MSQPLWFKKQFLFTAVASLLMALAACRSLNNDKPLATPLKPDGQALTKIGESFHPAFSPDSQKIVYASSGRPQHRQPQIYEMDLKTRKEKRLTYQGATAVTPQYNSKGDWILYASSTDELKEDPPIFHDKKVAAGLTVPAIYREPYEIYYHRLSGLEIQRLTKRLGFDGEPKFSSKNDIIFTRRTNNELSLMESALNSRNAKPLKGIGRRAVQPTPSPDGKLLAWVEYSEDFKTSDLKVKNGKHVSNLAEGLKGIRKDPAWTPDGHTILFAMSAEDAGKSEIYSVRHDGTCFTALTKDGVKAEQPAVSAAGDAFVFVADRGAGKQLYLRPLPASACNN